ncbi:MAG: PQQ-binding-like beta-propeller repeat protein, partial [Myxococcota bacterium]|nr:PQQ-binding-like beta-propeller repeat protein [Myxococcota bacterium]
PPPRDLPGAAARPPEPEIPADTTPLSARFAPRPLPIPRVSGGRSGRFTFDGHRRGWFARLPESRQNPLTPVYAQGRVMVGGGFTSHTFYAFDARTGELDWRAAAPDGGPTAAIVEDGKVLFNTESCTLFAVDVRTGRQRWSRWLGDPLMGQPAAANGRVFSGHIRDGGGFGFTAMDLDTGRILWTRPMPADVLNAPVLDGSDVYFTTMEGTVWRLDQASGRVLWRRRLDATSAPWLHQGTVHVARRERRRSAEGAQETLEIASVLGTSDGATIREHEGAHAAFLPPRPDSGGVEAGWAFEGSRPTIIDGRAYQTIGNEVQARDAESGALLWRRQYTAETRTRPASSPAIAGAQLVFGTRDGVLYGLDIDTGMTAWAYQVGEPIAAQPTVAHGWVYATTTRGGLVALEVSDSSTDGWHMWGGNAQHSGPVVGDIAPIEEDERPSEGTLQLGGAAREGELAGFPLQSTRVSAQVSGFAVRVTVEQEFANPYARPVEAVYLFPLPESAAVDAMALHAGNRVVRASIRRRHEAREQYDDARRRGVLASLLEQERPNLFRQSVANIRPGDTVRVVMSYTQALPYEEGSYRFVYPMVAGPRYQPVAEAGAPAPDAVHQVVLAPAGERPDRATVTIDADLGVAVSEITSPTHALEVARTNDRGARVTLREAARPDRDLDVRFHVAGAAPTVSVMASAPEGGEDGHLALSIHPRLDVPAGEVTARELVFVIDTSSSMHGRPIALARAAMIAALRGMREGDTFRVLGFSDAVSALSDTPLPATPENVTRAEAFVRDLRALGATEMISGLRAALEPAGEAGRMRVVMLLTDGYIGNEVDVFRAVHATLGDARVFAFGVGSAVNRYLLTRVAEEGRGDVQIVTLDELPERAAEAFHARIARPYLTDVTIDWNGLAVSDAYPRRLPDLFADRPLRVHARYARAGDGELVIRGRVAGQPFEQRVTVSLPASGGVAREELGSIWARTRIGDLMTAIELQPNATLQEEVTQLGLRHHLLTPWTAFLAIDEGYRADGEAVRVEQASERPAGVEAPTERMRGARVSMPGPPMRASASSGGGSMDSRQLGDELLGSGALASPELGASPRADRPIDGRSQLRREPIGARPTADSSRCYEAARRPDGSIDQEALRRCLAAISRPQRAPVQERARQGSPVVPEGATPPRSPDAIVRPREGAP